MTALTFCVMTLCQPLTSWSFTFEDAPPHWVHVTANGVEYGRCAACSYGWPQSKIVPDEISHNGFEP